MNYSEQIKVLKSKLAMKQSEFATFLGVSRTALSEFETGAREPSKDFILALGKKGISTDWFLTGEGEPFRIINYPNDENFYMNKDNKISSPPLPDAPSSGSIEKPHKEALVVVDGGVEQGVLIPVIGQGVSAGFGFDYEEGEIMRYVRVPAWLSRDGRNLIAVPVYGESMEPTLSRGNLAICDLGGFKDDGVYVLRDEERGLMFCKRLVWSPGGWTIVSDNPRYEPMKVEDKSIEVMARVIAAVKEVK
jgi:phage repressor protein C with HTH and peptisase S24 domain